MFSSEGTTDRNIWEENIFNVDHNMLIIYNRDNRKNIS